MERVSALEELTFELGSPKKQPGKEKNKVILDSNTLYNKAAELTGDIPLVSGQGRIL